MRKLMIGAAAALATAVPAAAQIQVPSGLVNVTVGDVVLRNILNDNEIEVLNENDILNNNQIQVAVPIGVAANVCGISAAVIGKSTSNPVCTADNETRSKALAQHIRKQHLRGN